VPLSLKLMTLNLFSFFSSFFLQSTPVGSTIYRNIQAHDKDAGVNGLVEYFIVEGSQNISDISPDTLTAADGFGVFSISYPHQGQVSLFI
jgi:protocadherin-15